MVLGWRSGCQGAAGHSPAARRVVRCVERELDVLGRRLRNLAERAPRTGRRPAWARGPITQAGRRGPVCAPVHTALRHRRETRDASEGRSTARGGEACVDRAAVTADAPPRRASAPPSPVEAATAEQKQQHDDDQQQFHSPLSMTCGPAPCARDPHDIRSTPSPDTDYAVR